MKLGLGGASEKNGSPRIERVAPAAAIPGGEIVIHGSGFAARERRRCRRCVLETRKPAWRWRAEAG